MKRITGAGLVLAGLLASGSAFAQSAMSSQFVTDQALGQYRVSKILGVDVYGADNQRVGDINDVIVDASGMPKAVVIGVGGFLGIGEKSVAVPYTALTWSTVRNVAATGTVAGTVNPGPAATSGMAATDPNAATTARRSPEENAAYEGRPDHAMVQLTKADLQNAPTFKYYSDTHRATNAPAMTAPAMPGAGTAMPGATAPTAPRP